MSKQPPQALQDEVFARQIAAAFIDGPKLSYADVARQLNITPALVRKICLSEKFKELVADASTGVLQAALDRARYRMAKLADKAIDVIDQNLDDGNLNAALAVLKGIGMDQKEEKTTDTVLNVILPGASPVPKEVSNTGDDTYTVEIPE